MNKFGFIAALIVGLAAVASATKFGHDIGEEGILHEGHHGFGRRPLGHIHDDLLLEELRFRGLGHGLGGGLGHEGLGIGRQGIRGNRFGKGRGVHRPRIGGIGAAGAIGGLEASRSELGAVGSSSHLGSHDLAEGSEVGLIGADKHFNAGVHEDDRASASGIHKHQAFNNDKTIIEDRRSGVNDVDGFSTSKGHSTGANLSGGSSVLAAKGKHGRLERDRDLEHQSGALGASNSQLAAGGAIGGIGAVGGEI